jgi:colicin import membrane protein
MSAMALTLFQDGEVVYDSTAARTAEPAPNDPPFDVDPPAASTSANDAQADKPKEPSATAVALVAVNNNLVEFDTVEAGLQALEKKYAGVIFADIQTPKGLKSAKEARAEVRKPRYAVQNAVDNAKGPLNTLKAAIAARGGSMIARITAVEDPIDAQVKAEEKRLADEKARLEREAAERKARIDAAIAEITSRVEACTEQPANFIAETIAWLDGAEVTDEEFGDRIEEVKRAVQETRDRLVRMQATAEEAELAAANAKILADKLKAQQDELDRRQAELDKREAALKQAEAAAAPAPQPEPQPVAAPAPTPAPAPAPAPRKLTPFELGTALEPIARAAYQQATEPAPAPVAAAPQVTAITAPAAAPVPVAAPVVAAPAPAAPKERRPTDDQIIDVLALHYRVHESKVIEWLLDVDLTAASERLAAAFRDDDLPF